MILNYDEEPAIGLEGQLALGFAGRQDVQTGVNAQTGRAKIAEIVFTGTWAAADSLVTTLAGVPVTTTLAAGEDTITEARDAHLADLQANANITRDYILTTDGTDAILVEGRERGTDTGAYVDFTATSVATTAGDGDVTVTATQSARTRGDLPFGKAVAYDETDPRGKRCVLPAATGFRFAGVTAFSHAHANRTLAGSNGIPAQDSFNRLKAGFIYVKAETDVQPGDRAFVRHTANANGEPGNFRNDADTNTADEIPGEFVTGGDAGSLVVLQINAPASP